MQQGNFQYLITAKFDAAGAEAAKKALRQATAEATAGSAAAATASRKAEEATRSLTDAQEDSAATAAAATKPAEEASEKASAATKKLTQGQRNLKDAIRGVALQFPILGRFAEAAINPLIGGVGLAITAITGLVFWLRDTHKTLSEIVKIDAPSEFARIAQANQDAQLSAAAHARELERVQNASQSIADTTNDIVKAIQDRKVAESEIDDAQKALALARVNEAEKKGTITAVTAIQQRAQIEEAASQRRVDRENKASQEIIRARESELQATLNAIAETQAALDRYTAQSRILGTGDDITRTLEAETKKQAALTAQIKKQQAFLDAGKNSFGQGYLPITKTAQQLTANQAKLDAVNRRIAAIRSDEPDIRAEIQATEEARTTADAKLKDLTTRKKALDRDIPKLTTQAQEAANQRNKVLGIDTQRRTVETSAATSPTVTAEDQFRAAQIVQTARTTGDGSVMANVIGQLVAADSRENAALLEAVVQVLNRIYEENKFTREDLRRRILQIQEDYNRKLTYGQ